MQCINVKIIIWINVLIFLWLKMFHLAHGLETCFEDFPEARKIFERQNEHLRHKQHFETVVAFMIATNVTNGEKRSYIPQIIAHKIRTNFVNLAKAIRQLGYVHATEPCVARQAKYLSTIGINILNDNDYYSLLNTAKNMHFHYDSTNVCSYKEPHDCSLSLQHVEERLSKSRDPLELEHYWKEWYDKAGTPLRKNFKIYVELMNTAALLNNFSSYAEYWIDEYEDPKFEENVDNVYKAILPLYRELHGYVRYRLSQHYGPDIVPPKGNIPMHLLGNLWGQQWDGVVELLTPYPKKPFADVTAEMKKQNYSVKKMFELGDDFFQSLAMKPLPKSFWNLSVFEKPKDRTIMCHASAFDMYTYGDVRVKMCTKVEAKYLYTVHHELGHIQYYLLYEQQPAVYRRAPNPGFQEAVGDVIDLSVASVKHLHALGLTSIKELDEQSRINELFKKALHKIAFLPFAYAMDKYRHAIFRKQIDEKSWNCAFWQMRSEFSGVEPAVYRSNRDFDPTAKYHVIAGVEYLRYFAAHIFQFQFHKALCTKAGQFVPGDDHKTLDNCDIYKSEAAGNAFKRFLSAGASRHWTEILQEFTGDTTMDPTVILEYFEPLRKWLEAENRKLNVPIGWGLTNKTKQSCGVGNKIFK